MALSSGTHVGIAPKVLHFVASEQRLEQGGYAVAVCTFFLALWQSLRAAARAFILSRVDDGTAESVADLVAGHGSEEKEARAREPARPECRAASLKLVHGSPVAAVRERGRVLPAGKKSAAAASLPLDHGKKKKESAAEEPPPGGSRRAAWRFSALVCGGYVLFGAALVARAECPNACSGHGFCGAFDMCSCQRNWMSGDCGERVCPFGRAFVDAPKGDLDGSEHISGSSEIILVGSELYTTGTSEEYPAMADSLGNVLSQTGHEYAECSSSGVCDRSTGECQCFSHFSGAACDRRIFCANDCSGHGKCTNLQKSAEADYDGVYALWDAATIYGCDCDPGYSGIDCAERLCPLGVDPVYMKDDERTVPVTVVTFAIKDEFCTQSMEIEAYPFLRRLSDVERTEVDSSSTFDARGRGRIYSDDLTARRDEYVRRGLMSIEEPDAASAFVDHQRQRGSLLNIGSKVRSLRLPQGNGSTIWAAAPHTEQGTIVSRLRSLLTSQGNASKVWPVSRTEKSEFDAELRANRTRDEEEMRRQRQQRRRLLYYYGSSSFDSYYDQRCTSQYPNDMGTGWGSEYDCWNECQMMNSDTVAADWERNGGHCICHTSCECVKGKGRCSTCLLASFSARCYVFFES